MTSAHPFVWTPRHLPTGRSSRRWRRMHVDCCRQCCDTSQFNSSANRHSQTAVTSATVCKPDVPDTYSPRGRLGSQPSYPPTSEANLQADSSATSELECPTQVVATAKIVRE